MITLYKNTQTEAESAGDLYAGRWSLSPYSPPSMFCAGRTDERAEFCLPSAFSPAAGDSFTCLGKIWRLATAEDGTPFLTQDGGASPVTLLRPGFQPPKTAAAARWVPRLQAGEWEIV